MKMKTRMISLSIVAILTLCLLNVVAASTSNPTTAPHSKIVTDVKAQQPTTLTFTAPAQANVKEWFNVSGSLTAGGKGVSGAIIKWQQLWQGKWNTFGNFTTDSNGNFTGQIESPAAGDVQFRVTYDGDSQYAPAVSNVVTITFS
jgi:hypothetical protein